MCYVSRRRGLGALDVVLVVHVLVDCIVLGAGVRVQFGPVRVCHPGLCICLPFLSPPPTLVPGAVVGIVRMLGGVLPSLIPMGLGGGMAFLVLVVRARPVVQPRMPLGAAQGASTCVVLVVGLGFGMLP